MNEARYHAFIILVSLFIILIAFAEKQYKSKAHSASEKEFIQTIEKAMLKF
jgi:hypothetical protein